MTDLLDKLDYSYSMEYEALAENIKYRHRLWIQITSAEEKFYPNGGKLVIFSGKVTADMNRITEWLRQNKASIKGKWQIEEQNTSLYKLDFVERDDALLLKLSYRGK